MPVNIFLDDTSTTKSKRWLPLHCIQMQLSGIPLEERHKEKSIHFLAASEKVNLLKLAELVVDDIKVSQRDGCLSYDASQQRECLIKCPLDVIVADYNVLSLCCNHLGASAEKYCPRCHASSASFNVLSRQRTPEETRRTISRLHLRSKEVDKAKLRKETGVKEHINCLWDVLDPHRDIPVGMLHLLPLGLTKHLITFLVNQMDKTQLARMSCHLETVLPSKGPDFFRYIESRQGKDFKFYLQVAPFNLLFGGANAIAIRLVCCLAQIQWQFYQQKIDTKLLNELQDNIYILL
ncbi:uncharacterized protein LOC111104890 [Crassostrea virginica]